MSQVSPARSFREAAEKIEAIWRPEIARRRIPSIGRGEAELLATLAAANGAKRTLELGTAIGYSAAYLAAGMGAAGRLVAVDLDKERAAVARRLWSQAGLADRIDLRQGNALELAPTLGADFDLVFVDLLIELRERDLGRQLALHVTAALRPGGILVADNCGQGAPAADGFMREVEAGPFRTSTLVPLGDGVFVAVKA
jgi:predicted O-methyltransferase YrrM